MADQEVHDHIDALAREEHELRQASAGVGFSSDQGARLAEIEESLDRCWDLLRQREALRRAGQDPDAAHERSASTVEGYLQ